MRRRRVRQRHGRQLLRHAGVRTPRAPQLPVQSRGEDALFSYIEGWYNPASGEHGLPPSAIAWQAPRRQWTTLQIRPPTAAQSGLSLKPITVRGSGGKSTPEDVGGTPATKRSWKRWPTPTTPSTITSRPGSVGVLPRRCHLGVEVDLAPRRFELLALLVACFAAQRATAIEHPCGCEKCKPQVPSPIHGEPL